MLPTPILPLFGPLLAGIVLLPLGRWQRVVGLLGAGVAVALWVMLAGAPVDGFFAGSEWVVLGRSFVLSEGSGMLLGLLYGGSALLFLVSAALPQGGLFVPLGLMVLSPLAVALMARPFSFGVVALLLAVMLLAALIQGEGQGGTRAAMRFLVMVAAALPLFLLADWMIGAGQLAFLGMLNRLLLLGLVVVLAGFPAHIWVGPVVEEGRPLVGAVLWCLMQGVVVVLVYQLLAGSEVLGEAAPFVEGLRLSGAALILFAGALAVGARRVERLLVDVLLIDMGVLLLVVGGEGGAWLAAALAMLAVRFIGLLLAGAGLALLPRVGRGRWAGLALFTYGTLSLSGLPLTVGFYGRWLAGRLAGGESAWMGWLVLLATVVGVVAVVRVLVMMVGESGWRRARTDSPRYEGAQAGSMRYEDALQQEARFGNRGYGASEMDVVEGGDVAESLGRGDGQSVDGQGGGRKLERLAGSVAEGWRRRQGSEVGSGEERGAARFGEARGSLSGTEIGPVGWRTGDLANRATRGGSAASRQSQGGHLEMGWGEWIVVGLLLGLGVGLALFPQWLLVPVQRLVELL